MTGERIRDKIAASKRKGMWMGGIVPVGYRANGRSLEPDPPQAERVRAIFGLYLALGSVLRLHGALQSKGWLTPVRDHRRPGFGGNKPFSRGHLYRILSNPVYQGMVVHKGQVHPGQHPAIVDGALWEAVQQRLLANRQGHRTRAHAAHASLLAGRLQDELGRRLVASHAHKGHKRYRYYVTPAGAPGDPVRLPAAEIEALVRQAVITWAEDGQRVAQAVGWGDARRVQAALAAGQRLAQGLKARAGTHHPDDPSPHLAACLAGVEVGPEAVRIALDLVGCGVVKAEPGAVAPVLIEVPAQRRRCGMAVRLVIGGPAATALRGPDPTWQGLLTKARDWLHRLTLGGQGIGEIARQASVTPGYVTRLLHLALLAPDIAQALAEGRQPPGLTATRLMRAMPLPVDWQEQRRVLALG